MVSFFGSILISADREEPGHFFTVPAFIQAGTGWWGRCWLGFRQQEEPWISLVGLYVGCIDQNRSTLSWTGLLYHRQRSVRHYGEMDKIRSKKKINNSSVEFQVPTNQAKSLTR